MTTSALRVTRNAPPPSFMLAMALVIVALVVYGFSRTFEQNLLHPAYARPKILYVHAAVMVAWLVLFLAQVALVRVHNVRLHRRLGRWGLALGTALPVVGVATAIAMARVRLAHGEVDAAVGVPVPINDVIAFSIAFSLAARWRTRPDYHRRLMYISTCILTAAAWGRMAFLDPYGGWFYAGVDLLVLTGAIADLIAIGRVHVVYKVALPALAVGQLITVYIRLNPGWAALAPRLFG